MKWRRVLLLTAACSAGAVLAAVLLTALAALWYAGRLEYPHFDQIRPGDSRQRVLALMGKPHEESPQFRLGQEYGYEKEYAEARAAGAATWLIYHGGLDQTFAIGLDANGAVVYKARGGT